MDAVTTTALTPTRVIALVLSGLAKAVPNLEDAERGFNRYDLDQHAEPTLAREQSTEVRTMKAPLAPAPRRELRTEGPLANMSNPVIRTVGLSKTYDGVEALKSLTLEVLPKSIFAFLGPNGAGKTTTIKLLLGLTRPTAGSGTIFGKDIVSESVDIRARVGYLPQDARFYDHMTARETLQFAAGFFYQGPRRAVDKRVDEMIELVGLTGKADRPIKGFSGGERQRLGIAQAEVNYRICVTWMSRPPRWTPKAGAMC